MHGFRGCFATLLTGVGLCLRCKLGNTKTERDLKTFFAGFELAVEWPESKLFF